MEINNLTQNIDLDKNLENEKEQKSFLETTLGQVVNTGLDIGIRAVLPDFIEEQVINIKDNILNYGLKDGIKETIDNAIDLGKSVLGIFTGNFENTNQMKLAVENGGLIDGISNLLDLAIDKATVNGKINSNVANLLTNGKDAILGNIENKIEETFNEQNIYSENISTYINDWKNAFENRDFEKMEKEYLRINKEIKKLAPIENIINEAKNIDILHNLIKNNGKNFDLSAEQMELINKLK